MPKIQGIFTPYLDSNKLLNGRHLQGPITASNISSSGFIHAEGTISSSGAVSASALYVNGTLFEGSTIATGITGTPNITVGQLTASSITSSGDIYSFGSITASNNIVATNFYGNGSGLTSVTATSAAGLTGTPNITVGQVTASSLKCDSLDVSGSAIITGSLVFNAVAFTETVINTTTGSHVWGTDSDSTHYFTGSVTASVGFSGNGANLTDLPSQTANDFTNVQRDKLYGIESGSTADQTGAEIKTALFAESDTNNFTNVQRDKLYGIESSSNNYVHPTTAGNKHIPAGGSAGQILKYSSAGTATWEAEYSYNLPAGSDGELGGFYTGYAETGSRDYSVAALESKMFVHVPWTDTTYAVTDGQLSQNNFTNTLKSKLDSIAETTQSTNATDNVQFAQITGSSITCSGDVSSSGGVFASGFFKDGVALGISNFAAETIGEDMLPDSTEASRSLGSESKKWANVYATNTFFGGVHEINLETKDIGKLPEGTILVHSDKGLVPCTIEGDYLVMGVSSPNTDYPIILGAEPVLIDGPISSGDFIITSTRPGYGKAVKPSDLYAKNYLGKIIAQSLENSNGGLIKAMIRKM